ncbi:GGDEF domain-containing protein [Marinobacter similis]|uniref:diguanylate cyclase n=1 Tax=Marinobacter similis TaxID=1420916 RepID=W5YH76_9GAMM|nr:sensor domain-containing diguanylate cyclase [Marinobacter similis]AHI28431.1 diguanylate cyclase [Marinobacter similis]
MYLSAETRLKAILEGTGAGTWEFNLDTEEIIFNDRWASMLGYSLEELAPISFQTWSQLCHPDDVEAAFQALDSYLNGNSAQYECVLRMQHKDGDWRYIHTRGTVFASPQETEARWLMGTHLDVTEEKRRQHQLQQLAESLPGVIYTFVLDSQGQYQFPFLSRKAEEFYGVSADAAMANPQLLFDSIHPDDLPRVHQSILTSADTLNQWSCDYRIVRECGYQWVRGTSQPERGPDGSVTWHGIITNIDDQKRLEQKLERLSITDELTGLYNLRYLLMKLDECAAETERYGATFSVASLDIDYFKSVNDRWGHPAGDRVLQGIAELLRQRTRRADIVARTGGEEFIVLMPRTNLDDARHLMESLRSDLAEKVFTSDSGDAFSVTLSAGVACWSEHTSSVSHLLSACDQSLYAAKHAGRNRVLINSR